MPNILSRKRNREDNTDGDTTTAATSSTTTITRRTELGPPIVINYAPYTGGQLQQSVMRRQVERCADQWDRYYTHNTVNGYKDRHYLLREFTELHNALLEVRSASSCTMVGDNNGGDKARGTTEERAHKVELIEIGCGVGNAVIPMLEDFSDLKSLFVAYGFDISRVAVEHLQKKVADDATSCSGALCNRLFATVHDLTTSAMALGSGPDSLLPHPVRFGTIIFVLSAIPVDKLPVFVERVATLISVGGFVFVRDYCVGDQAQRRFVEGGRQVPQFSKEVDDDAHASTYMRSNGTLSHFFSPAELESLFVTTGMFAPVRILEVDREVENRKEKLTMHRRFLQATFRRV